MILFVLIWIIIVLYKASICDKCSNPLSKENVLAVRGICAFEIMLGHLGVATESVFLYPNRKAGILFVGVFFVLSGYGLAYSVATNKDYIKTFIKNRIPKILVPAFVIYIIYILLQHIFNGGAKVSYIDALNPLAFFDATNWYVWELVGLYILFWICVRFDILKKNYLLILAVSLVFVCVAYVCEIGKTWYGSTLCFWQGLMLFEAQEKFKRYFVSKHPFLNIVVLGVLTCVSIALFYFLDEGSIVGNVIARNVASISFSYMIIIILYCAQIGNNVSKWLGKYSYEIFLFHPFFILLFREIVNNDIVFSLVVIFSSCLASYIYRNCANAMKRLMQSWRDDRE